MSFREALNRYEELFRDALVDKSQEGFPSVNDFLMNLGVDMELEAVLETNGINTVPLIAGDLFINDNNAWNKSFDIIVVQITNKLRLR